MEEEVAVATSSQLGAEAVRLLQELIRIDTSNPPGNERPAQELLGEALGDAGFRCELLGALPDRPNLAARLPGEGPGPTLCILGHADTVPADPSEWSRDPWSGDLVDGEVWGRGAQDMKGQVAAEVAATAALAREGWRPARGDLLVVITADEERGGLGAEWLCREHPEAVRCELVINEGGGTALVHEEKRLYPIAVGEKGIFRFKLRVRGRAGHASIPRMGDNALIKLAPYLERLREQPAMDPGPEAIGLLAALGEDVTGDGPDNGFDPESLAVALERVGKSHPYVAACVLEPMLGVTLTPTQASASQKENVIPSRAEVLVDCRVPPGLGEDQVRDRIREALGEDGYEIEFTDRVVGNRSSPETPLFRAIAEWLDRADPGAKLVPKVLAGFTDSNWFRRAFGTVAYGFCPHNSMTVPETDPLVHAPDERVRVADVDLAARFFFEIPQEILA